MLSKKSLGRWFWKETVQVFPAFFALVLLMLMIDVFAMYADRHFDMLTNSLEQSLWIAPAAMFALAIVMSVGQDRQNGSWDRYSLLPTRWYESFFARLTIAIGCTLLVWLIAIAFAKAFILTIDSTTHYILPVNFADVHSIFSDPNSFFQLFIAQLIFSIAIGVSLLLFCVITRDLKSAVAGAALYLLTLMIVGDYIKFSTISIFWIHGAVFLLSVACYRLQWGRFAFWEKLNLSFDSFRESSEDSALMSTTIGIWRRPFTVTCLLWMQLRLVAIVAIIAVPFLLFYVATWTTSYESNSTLFLVLLVSLWGAMSFVGDRNCAMQFEADRGIGRFASWSVRCLFATAPILVAFLGFSLNRTGSFSPLIMPYLKDADFIAAIAMMIATSVLAQQVVGKLMFSNLLGFGYCILCGMCITRLAPTHNVPNGLYSFIALIVGTPFILGCSWWLWHHCYRFGKEGLVKRGMVVTILSFIFFTYIPALAYLAFSPHPKPNFAGADAKLVVSIPDLRGLELDPTSVAKAYAKNRYRNTSSPNEMYTSRIADLVNWSNPSKAPFPQNVLELDVKDFPFAFEVWERGDDELEKLRTALESGPRIVQWSDFFENQQSVVHAYRQSEGWLVFYLLLAAFEHDDQRIAEARKVFQLLHEPNNPLLAQIFEPPLQKPSSMFESPTFFDFNPDIFEDQISKLNDSIVRSNKSNSDLAPGQWLAAVRELYLLHREGKPPTGLMSLNLGINKKTSSVTDFSKDWFEEQYRRKQVDAVFAKFVANLRFQFDHKVSPMSTEMPLGFSEPSIEKFQKHFWWYSLLLPEEKQE